MHTLISPENTWLLMTLMFATVSAAIYLEQTYAWASRLSGAVIAMVIAAVLVNTGVIPPHAPAFDDVIWGYAVPMAIPLLLLQANLSRIWKQTGRLLFIFLIGSAGTVVGAVAGTALMTGMIRELPKVAAMMTGSYIGGGVNFVALSDAFHASSTIISAAVVADNLNMAIYFLVLIGIAGSALFRRWYRHPYIEEMEQHGLSEEGKTKAASYWKRRDISLRDMAVAVTYAAIVVTVSRSLGEAIGAAVPGEYWFSAIGKTFFGSAYVWITLISMTFATFCSRWADGMNGAQEIGTYFIYLFFFVIGVPASVMEIVRNAPILFVFCFFMVVVNMLFCFIGGRLFHFTLEEIILASNANIGGPTTAAGMAIAQGWTKLVGPSLLIGSFGYVIGTYLGILVGGFLGAS